MFRSSLKIGLILAIAANGACQHRNQNNPDATTLDTEARKLFYQKKAPLESVSFNANFTLMREKASDGEKHEVVGEIAISNGSKTVTVPAKFSFKGAARLTECTTPGIKVDVVGFKTDEIRQKLAGTELENNGKFQVLTHCEFKDWPEVLKVNWEQRVMRECAVYSLLQSIGAPSFQSRAAKLSYLDTSTNQSSSHLACILETKKQVASRITNIKKNVYFDGGSEEDLTSLRNNRFRSIDKPALLRAVLAEIFSGNNDWSIGAYSGGTRDGVLVNSMIVPTTPVSSIEPFEPLKYQYLPVVYDFDLGSLVSGSKRFFETNENGRLHISLIGEKFFPKSANLEETEELYELTGVFLFKLSRLPQFFGRQLLDKELPLILNGRQSFIDSFQSLPLDAKNKELLIKRANLFFTLLQAQSFYMPKVSLDNVYSSETGTERCDFTGSKPHRFFTELERKEKRTKVWVMSQDPSFTGFLSCNESNELWIENSSILK